MEQLMQQVRRSTLTDWSLWFDEAARWEDGPASVPAAIAGDVAGWRPEEPTGGWRVLEHGACVPVPSVTDQARPGYHGVSWWSTEVELSGPCSPRLKFGAARLLAEVFWDCQLVGIDLEGYTPFEAVVPARLAGPGRHRIDVRITNPGGAQGWEDFLPFSWGPLRLPSSHDFGGLWQPVTLEAAGGLRIADVWARPSRALDAALVDVAVRTPGPAQLGVQLFGPGADPAEPLAMATIAIDGGTGTHSVALPVADPALYGPGLPNLYRVVVRLHDEHGSDETATRFGFRMLDADGAQLRYNGSPFYLRSAISWSRYTDGPVASDQELRNEVESLLALGQNAVSAHRRLATPALADALEQAGLLLYQEPGGLPSLRTMDSRWPPLPQIADTVRLMEKRVRRLARRDRSRACLVWWNLANEIHDPDDGDPGPIGWQLLRALREEDDSRVTTFSSAWNQTPMYRPFTAEPTRSFDYHTVLNWPAAWHQEVAEQYAALRPPFPMPFLSGESANMDGLGWVPRQAEGVSSPQGETAVTRKWLQTLDADLSALDPGGRVGGAAALCAATAANQAYGIARMIESNRANPHIDGLAINAWHSHTTIGTMGLTGPDRRLAVEPEPIRRANADIAVAIQGVRPVLAVGETQRVSLVLIDGTHACSGEAAVQLRQAASDGGGRGPLVEKFSVTLPATGERVRHLADVDLVATTVGLMTVDVTVVISGQPTGTQVRFRAVAEPGLAGTALAVHDPRARLARFIAGAGIDAARWHTFADAPVLFAGTNLDPWPAMLSGPATRSVCVLDSHPSGEGSSLIMGLRLSGFRADAPPPGLDALHPFAPVKGHWIGGWGVTVDPQIMPSLVGEPVWDWTLNSILPDRALRAAPGRTLTAAVTFPAGDLLATGEPRVLATTVLLRRGERQVVLTTLPLTENADRDPLAAAVLADLIRWAAEGPAAERPETPAAERAGEGAP